MKIPVSCSISLPLFGSILTGVASGAGFYLPNQSVEATARGNAWVATADSVAAVYYNPAGLVQLDAPSLEVGVYGIQLGNSARIGDSEFGADNIWQAVPHFYYAQPVAEDWTLGFGINSPFGLGTEWGDDTPFRQITTKADLINIRASVMLGYRVNETFSIGGGIGLNYAEAVLRQGLTPYNPIRPASDFVEFDGDDLGFSWTLGMLWQPHEQHSFGAVYRSKVDYELDGVLNGSDGFGLPLGSAGLDISTPASAAVGYAYRPTKKLTIEANVEWIHWSSLDAITINTPLGSLPTQRFDWKSSFIYAIGMNYQINDAFGISIGYDYNESSQPDAFYTPAVADADRHWLNAGISYQTGKYRWDVAYQYGFSDNEVTDSLIGTNGSYKSKHHAVMISGRFDF